MADHLGEGDGDDEPGPEHSDGTVQDELLELVGDGGPGFQSADDARSDHQNKWKLPAHQWEPAVEIEVEFTDGRQRGQCGQEQEERSKGIDPPSCRQINRGGHHHQPKLNPFERAAFLKQAMSTVGGKPPDDKNQGKDRDRVSAESQGRASEASGDGVGAGWRVRKIWRSWHGMVW